MLAHITPKEAAMLKARGGRGSINPDTGLPEFDDGFFFDPTPISYQPADFSSFEPPSYTPEAITQGPVYQAPTQDYTFLSQPAQGFEQPFQAAQYTGGFQPDIGSNYYAGAFPDQYSQATPAEIAQGRSDVQSAYRTRYAPLPADVALKAYGTPGSDIGGGEAIKAAAQQQQALTPVEGGLTEQDRQEIERQLREDLPAVRADERAAAQLAAAQRLSAQTGGLAGVPGQKPGALYTPPSFEEFQKGVAGAGGPAAAAETKGIQTPFGTLGTKDLIAALGLGGLGLSYMNAQNQGKKAAQQLQGAYNQASAQEMALAQPYMQQGGTQLAQALTGALSPAQQQQLAAGQAAAAQATAGSGGAAAAQAGRSVEDLRQRLLSNQQAMALSLLGAGQGYVGRAIQDQLSGTVSGINTQMQLSQQAGQAATGMLGMLAMMYGRSA
jgi:hypothetical protein